MLIEIHLLQNHSPGNLNRDELGAPKSAYFGGRLRGRISSQCLKRNIRLFPDFQVALAGHLGERTKFFPHLVGERLKSSKIIPAEQHQRLVAACTRIAKSEDGSATAEREKKADPRPQTPQLIYLDPCYVKEFVTRLERLKGEMPKAFDYYLNPIAGFQEVIEATVKESNLPNDVQAKLVKNAWVIAQLRKAQLASVEGEEDDQDVPGGEGSDSEQKIASWIVGKLEALSLREENKSKELLKDVLKPANKQEKERLKGLAPDKPKDYDKFLEQLKVPLQYDVVDIALFGRMTTSDAFEDVEACLEVAHAISTNEMVREVDYFTAVDDRGVGVAAAHVGENQFTSCTYYKYFSLDWKAFTERLAGPTPTPETREKANDLARKALRELIRAAVFAVPSGKKKGHAHNNVADAILVEVKAKRIPTSYGNAFLTPAVASSDGNPLEDSIRKLGHYAGMVQSGYNLAAQQFWFDLHQRRPLIFNPPAGDGAAPRAETLARSQASIDDLITAVEKGVQGQSPEDA